MTLQEMDNTTSKKIMCGGLILELNFKWFGYTDGH